MTLEAANEFYTRERCWILELFNSPDYPEASIARCRVEPGVTTELHSLSVAETYVISKGTGRMQRGDETPFSVVRGDTVAIPAGVAQAITNTGEDELVFLCICVPRFEAACYTALE